MSVRFSSRLQDNIEIASSERRCQLPHAAAKLKADSAIINGEIVATTEDGNPRFLKLLRGDGRHLSFIAFDIMWRDGQDLRALPLIERKKHIAVRSAEALAARL